MIDEQFLQIPADVKELARVRRFIQEAAIVLGAGDAAVEDLVLAVDEAVTNIIVHGYNGKQGKVEIEASHSGDTIQVRLRDHAPIFDPTQVPDPDLDAPLEQRPLGGMGIFLMKNTLDGISHRVTEQGGNELTLIKKIV